jgi:hypothetical protein
MRVPVVFLAAALVLSPGAATGQTLANGLITARFGQTGLTSISDEAEDESYGLSRDAFSVTIDGARYGGPPAPPARKTADAQRVTYTWDAGPHAIHVTYELKPGWRFLSKQIAVDPATGNRVRVDEVVVFDATLTTHVSEAYIPQFERKDLGLGSYAAALRFAGGTGLLALAQNPFLEIARERSSFTIGYRPALEWNRADGAITADRGILAPYRSTGVVLPARMRPEWRMTSADASPGMDEAEVAAFTEVVRAFMLHQPREPVNIFVGWCVNDYQIDIATEAGRSEYKRVIDRAAELGAEHVLFAPTNSSLARRDDSTDDWKWENLLWLGLGQKIRRNEWSPARDPVPASVQEMLDYAKSRKVSLVAYVYPVLAFTQNPEWLVTRANAKDPSRKYANLGYRSLQDWLIDTLVEFRKKTGISGYAFDHTFLTFEGPSPYAQWAGWRRVMETLRARMPDIVIDGRQAYHLYGPWSWLAGTYPHPTYSDEQPESFTPFPDLSFDRVSANRERYTAYRYRNYDFAPSELVPGFVTHQTSRSDETGEMPQHQSDRGIVLEPFRVRDWDYLGWRYSLLSSIAVGGWNNVINMIPARDLEEYRHFSTEDLAWFRGWLEWARRNREALRHTRTILGEPGIGRIDGTAAIVNDHGYIFLFNPNARTLRAEVPLDGRIGLSGSTYHVEELHPVAGRRIGRPGRGWWSHGDVMSLRVDGHSAAVLAVQPFPGTFTEPMLFNVAGSVDFADGVLSISDLQGEPGTSADVGVLLPARSRVKGLRINGRDVDFSVSSGGAFIEAAVTFEGTLFGRAEPIVRYDPAFAGGTVKGHFTVPQRIFNQLAARRKAWPISYTEADLRATWLAPHRLLLYVQIAEPDDKWDLRMTIDGQPVELQRAYSAVRAARGTFVGFYADLSAITPDQEHTMDLRLPALQPGQFQGVFFENVEPEHVDQVRNRQ